MGTSRTAATAALLTLALGLGCRPALEPAGGQVGSLGEAKASEGPRPTPGSADSRLAAERRDRSLSAAVVWRPPAIPIPEAQLGRNPPGNLPLRDTDDLGCRLALDRVGGTTPKFHCETPAGVTVKVKYGSGNPELHAEVAASRLISALGFGADRMFVVGRVLCAGCPAFPFQALRCLAKTGLERACFGGGIDYGAVTAFEPAVVEHRLEGRTIAAVPDQGWAWYELDRIDPARGGSPRAHVDALKLLAVLLAHWDNKAENQRLICLPGGDLPDGDCARPLALMQDLGATFGPTKLDIRNWRRTAVWNDARACRVSMEHLPFGGGTFPEQQISDEGRRFLLGLLRQLSARQLHELFVGSRVTAHDGVSLEGRSADAWVRAFQDKVQQIAAAGPCPT